MISTKRQAVLDEVETQLRNHYPSLYLVQRGSHSVIRGVYPVQLDGKVIDTFLVEIALPRHFPEEAPTVREMSGRILRVADRHVYTDGTLCLFLPEEKWKYWPEGSSILDFLTGPVNDFFLSQLYFEQHGTWPFGERRHGVLGIIDYYAEELGTDDLQVITKALEYLSAPQPKGHWPCYCGSGKRMRHCHFEKLSYLHRRIQPTVAANSLGYVRNALEHQKAAFQRQIRKWV